MNVENTLKKEGEGEGREVVGPNKRLTKRPKNERWAWENCGYFLKALRYFFRSQRSHAYAEL